MIVCECMHAMSDHHSEYPHTCGQCDCTHYQQENDFIDSVYVIVANDGESKECIVIRDMNNAYTVYNTLQEIWGGQHVAIFSRAVDDIPLNVLEHMKDAHNGSK